MMSKFTAYEEVKAPWSYLKAKRTAMKASLVTKSKAYMGNKDSSSSAKTEVLPVYAHGSATKMGATPTNT